MSAPMDPERLALLVSLIADTGERHWASQPESDPTGTAELLAELAEELLEDRDYTCTRAIELRRQAEVTCVRRTAERDKALQNLAAAISLAGEYKADLVREVGL